MNCACHGDPAYWQKDKRLKAGGWWECPRKRKAANATRTTDPARRARVLAQNHKYWYRVEGGYVKERRRDLAAARERVLEQLDQLAQEAEAC